MAAQYRRYLVWAAILAIVVADIWLMWLIAGKLGPVALLLLLAAKFVLGVWLIAFFWRKAAADYKDPNKRASLADPFLIVLGGLFVMVPGPITDVLGLAMILPFTRRHVRALLGWAISKTQLGKSVRLASGGVVVESQVVDDTGQPTDSPSSSSSPEPRVIRGEIAD